MSEALATELTCTKYDHFIVVFLNDRKNMSYNFDDNVKPYVIMSREASIYSSEMYIGAVQFLIYKRLVSLLLSVCQKMRTFKFILSSNVHMPFIIMQFIVNYMFNYKQNL